MMLMGQAGLALGSIAPFLGAESPPSPTIDRVTDHMSTSAMWSSIGQGSGALANQSALSAYVQGAINPSDEGIILETGDAGQGLILYCYAGSLYLQCGDGGAASPGRNRAFIKHAITAPITHIELSASASTGRAALYVNGQLAGLDVFTNASVTGTSDGAMGQVQTSAPANLGSWTTSGAGAFTGTLAQAEFFFDQLTPEVASAPRTVVFAIGGQSNSTSRAPFDNGADWPLGVRQVGRAAGPETSHPDDVQVPAARPLDHDTQPQSGGMGFVLQFALDYLNDNPGTELVLVPCGYGGSSFSANQWNPGDPLYQDLVDRTNTLLAAQPSYELGGILWHQGESDAGLSEAAYATALDAALSGFRQDILDADDTTPIILGQMADIVSSAGPRAAIADTPNRLYHTAVVDTAGLATFDAYHFTAASYRTMGSGYHAALATAIAAEPPVIDPLAAEADALGHWLFGSDNTALEDELTAATLSLAGVAPSFDAGGSSDAREVVLQGAGSGLISPISDRATYTICGVVQYAAPGNIFFFGNCDETTNGAGLFGAAPGNVRFRTDYSGGKTLDTLIDPFPSVPVFIAYTRLASGQIRVFLGGASPTVVTTTGQAAAVLGAPLGFGDSYFGNPALTGTVRLSEGMIFDGEKSVSELTAIYERSKLRMAARNVSVL